MTKVNNPALILPLLLAAAFSLLTACTSPADPDPNWFGEIPNGCGETAPLEDEGGEGRLGEACGTGC